MPTFGQRPDDVVQDSRGNALSGVTLKLYATEALASAGGTPLATVVTDESGRWQYASDSDECWLRLATGAVWQVAGLGGPRGLKGDTGADSTVPGPEGPVGPQGPPGPTTTDASLLTSGTVADALLPVTAQAISVVPAGDVAAKSAILTSIERTAKGGVVGVGNKAVITFRWDDWQDVLRTDIVPLFKARGLPAAHVLISRFQTAQPWGAGTTWADIMAWTRAGIEIWCHGTDHKDPTPDGDPGIYREIVTAKAEIEAQGIKVMGFAPPGTTPLTEAQPFGTVWASAADYNTYCGRLIQANYGISDGYMTGTKFRTMPFGIHHGVTALSINMTDGGTTQAQVTAVIDKAIERGWCAQLFGHAGNIGAAGNMTLAQITAVLDYVVAKRDAGLLEVLTPSAAHFASPDTTRRLELYRDGSFDAVTTGDTRWAGWSTKTIQTTGGHSSANFLRILAADTGYLTQTTDSLDEIGVGGEVFMFEAWARCGDTLSSVLDFSLTDTVNAALRPTTTFTKVITGTTWQKVMLPFSLYRDQPGVSLKVRRASGSSTTLDLDDIRVYKV